MSSGMNRWFGIGHLGKDAELRYTQTGTAVLSGRIACGERYRDTAGQMQERVEWVNLVMYGKRAEGLSKLLTKGSRVAVFGKLRSRSFEDKQGITRYVTEVRLDDLVLLSSKGRQVPDGELPAPDRSAEESIEDDSEHSQG